MKLEERGFRIGDEIYISTSDILQDEISLYL